MAIFYFFIVHFLSFMYFIIIFIFKKMYKSKKIHIWLDQNFFLVWLFIIIVLTLLFNKSIPLNIPKQWLSLKEVLLYILFTIPFMLYSNYKIHPSKKGIFAFTFAFPLGEELLFRGIIPAMVILAFPNTVLIPFPLLKEVSLPVFISSILFSVMHLQYFNFKIKRGIVNKLIFAFIFGIFIGNLVEITNSLFYGILFHIIANAGAAYISLKRPYKENNFD